MRGIFRPVVLFGDNDAAGAGGQAGFRHVIKLVEVGVRRCGPHVDGDGDVGAPSGADTDHPGRAAIWSARSWFTHSSNGSSRRVSSSVSSKEL